MAQQLILQLNQDQGGMLATALGRIKQAQTILDMAVNQYEELLAMVRPVEATSFDANKMAFFIETDATGLKLVKDTLDLMDEADNKQED